MAAALLSADFAASPIELEAYSLQGIEKMVTTIANIRRANPASKFLGMIPSKVDGRNPRHGQHLDESTRAYPQLVIPTPIGNRSSVADASASGVPVCGAGNASDGPPHSGKDGDLTMADNTEDKKPGKSSTKAAQKPAQNAGLGLEGLGDLSSLLASPAAPEGGSGAPLELESASIDEDPNQPRKQFDENSSAEMAETIRERGVKTPISVRPNPKVEGRYLINHGARRYRASSLAEKVTIPGFIDPDYTEADQVIENLQRDALTAREIADYIGRESANGKKKGEIAKAIGKSPAFVTQHAALLDLPEPIAKAFQSGRCKDVTLSYDLVGLHKKHSEGVARWSADADQEITRGSVRLLKEFLESG
ncbi:hypothetical protein OY671_007883, partial [Metschnikowia pulcherrima]